MSELGRALLPQFAVPATVAELRPPPAGVADPGSRLLDVLRAFMRRRKLIVLVLLALNVVAFAAVTAVRPRYTAEATLLIGPRQQQVLDLKAVLAGLSGDSEAIESEVQVLRSRKVAREIVGQLHLDQDPEFVPTQSGPGPVRLVLGALRERWNILAARYRPELEWPAPAPEAPARDAASVATENFQRRLGISPRGRSRVIAVTFDSASPSTAAAVANAVMDTYISDQLRTKRDATASAHRWLEDRVAELREKVIAADQQVAAYRRRAAITQGRTGTLLSEQISSLGEQAVQARVARANAESRLRSLQGGNAANLPEVQSSPTIQALRAQESTMTAAAAELSRTYGENHPRVAAARAAAGAVAARIGAETSKVAAALADEARTAKVREESLNASLARLRQEVDTGTESEVELHALQHEAEANRALYDRLLARSRETNVEGGLQQPDAQVISRAEVPNAPSFPNPAVVLPVFFLASCIFTVLLVFALEAMESGFTTVERLEQATGIPALGLLPRVRGGRRSQVSIFGTKGSSPASAYAEAVCGLHTSLMLSRAERPKVVLVASALPGEGRSTVVMSMARLMAGAGKRVVVVDCDLRRPTLHRACGASVSPGLADCLADGTPVFDVLQGDRSSPVFVVAAGTRLGSAPDLFASEALRQLIAALRERFDLVLLDSSPVLAVSETRNLCRLADTTMMVVRWAETRRDAVLAGIRQVLGSGGHIAGLVLSNVDLRQYARHSASGATQRRIDLYLSE